MRIGWIGVGRMGAPMAMRLLKAGHAVTVWNRTRSKTERLAKAGAKIADNLSDMAEVDVLYTMLSTGPDVLDLCFGERGLFRPDAKRCPAILVDCSTIGPDESAQIRTGLAKVGAEFLASPVSGNPRCVAAGKFSCVVSGPRSVFEQVKPLMITIAPRGAAYAGEGELSRVCKIALNLMLAVVNENLMEVTLLAEKAGVPRHAFLEFVNNSVMGSTFTRYKTPALVNLDWTVTFPPSGQRKDVDLGLKLARELEVPMPTTAAMRQVLEAHFGAARLQPDPDSYLRQDFASMFETMALLAGVTLRSEQVSLSDGLDVEEPIPA